MLLFCFKNFIPLWKEDLCAFFDDFSLSWKRFIRFDCFLVDIGWLTSSCTFGRCLVRWFMFDMVCGGEASFWGQTSMIGNWPMIFLLTLSCVWMKRENGDASQVHRHTIVDAQKDQKDYGESAERLGFAKKKRDISGYWDTLSIDHVFIVQYWSFNSAFRFSIPYEVFSSSFVSAMFFFVLFEENTSALCKLARGMESTGLWPFPFLWCWAFSKWFVHICLIVHFTKQEIKSTT